MDVHPAYLSDLERSDLVGDARPDTMLRIGRRLIVVLLLAVSPLALYWLGWQYFDTGGSPIEKFHPAVLLSAGLVLWIAGRDANPVSGLIALGARYSNLLPYLAANLFMMAYAAVIVKLPVTIFIETFIGAALVYMVFTDLPEDEGRVLAYLVHALMFLNAALGFIELIEGFHLTPLVVNGEILADEPRSTALLGHPLANAMLVGAYVVILAVGGGRDLPVYVRAVCFVVAITSLVPFGGRAATAITLVTLALLCLRRFWAIARGATVEPRSIMAALIIGPLAALALVAAYELGALDTFIARLTDDEGSASTRIEMFELFKYLNAYDLMFGPDPAVLMTWVRLHGLEYGIESFIVAFVLSYGIIAAVVFFPTLLSFLYGLTRVTRRGTGLAIVYFLAVCLTSISLSSKSPSLSIFVLMLLILLRRQRYDDDDSSEFGEQTF
jgi:hypothetical protein